MEEKSDKRSFDRGWNRASLGPSEAYAPSVRGDDPLSKRSEVRLDDKKITGFWFLDMNQKLKFWLQTDDVIYTYFLQVRGPTKSGTKWNSIDMKQTLSFC